MKEKIDKYSFVRIILNKNINLDNLEIFAEELHKEFKERNYENLLDDFFLKELNKKKKQAEKNKDTVIEEEVEVQ